MDFRSFPRDMARKKAAAPMVMIVNKAGTPLIIAVSRKRFQRAADELASGVVMRETGTAVIAVEAAFEKAAGCSWSVAGVVYEHLLGGKKASVAPSNTAVCTSNVKPIMMEDC